MLGANLFFISTAALLTGYRAPAWLHRRWPTQQCASAKNRNTLLMSAGEETNFKKARSRSPLLLPPAAASCAAARARRSRRHGLGHGAAHVLRGGDGGGYNHGDRSEEAIAVQEQQVVPVREAGLLRGWEHAQKKGERSDGPRKLASPKDGRQE